LSVDVDAGTFGLLVGGAEISGADINAALTDQLEAAIQAAYGHRPSLDNLSNVPLVGLSNVLTDHNQRAQSEAAANGSLLDLDEGLAYEPRRVCQWKHEPFLVTTGEFA
jgi:hypothetical protein